MQTQECPMCSSVFAPTRDKQTYCSHRCFEDSRKTRECIEARFWKKVNKSGDCWLWLGSRISTGYGNFSSAGKMVLAHRFAYELTYGAIPNGLQICHHCDTPQCVNPAHLFPGTYKNNSDDKIAKGRHAHGDTHGMRRHPDRQPRGEANGQAKITRSQAQNIRDQYVSGVSVIELAREHGIAKRTVYHVLQGATWKD